MPEDRINRLLKSIFGFPAPVPRNLSDFLSLPKKADVENYAHKLTISAEDLCDLIKGCQSIGLLHEARFNEFVPDHLELTPVSFRQAAESNDPKQSRKLFRKMRTVFAERKIVAAHFFYNSDGKWHLFYFSCKETDDERNNHWEHGTHVHFVNYLWPNVDPGVVRDAISTSRQLHIPGSLHIRFVRRNDDQSTTG